MNRPDVLTAQFHERGLKVTPQRQLLFRLLHDNSSHPTAEGLFAQASASMPGISLRTVYHTLNDLVAMGELRAVTIGGATRFDANTAEHHHTRCTECGAVDDIYLPDVAALPAQSLNGFVADHVHVVVTGACARCAAKRSQHTTSTIPQGDQP